MGSSPWALIASGNDHPLWREGTSWSTRTEWAFGLSIEPYRCATVPESHRTFPNIPAKLRHLASDQKNL